MRACAFDLGSASRLSSPSAQLLLTRTFLVAMCLFSTNSKFVICSPNLIWLVPSPGFGYSDQSRQWEQCLESPSALTSPLIYL